MKALKFVSTLLLLSFVLLTVQVKSQNVGKAADKQKQENLEKIKKHQAEMKNKYNSMTPEQQAEARKKAGELKKGGGKVTPKGSGINTKTNTTKPASQPIVSKTPEQQKQGTVKKSTHSNKPVWMDEKGRPKPVAPVSGEVSKTDSKPTSDVKSTDVKRKVAPAKAKVKTTKQVAKSSASEGVKK
jgi:hypothetical protein